MGDHSGDVAAVGSGECGDVQRGVRVEGVEVVVDVPAGEGGGGGEGTGLEEGGEEGGFAAGGEPGDGLEADGFHVPPAF